MLTTSLHAPVLLKARHYGLLPDTFRRQHRFQATALQRSILMPSIHLIDTVQQPASPRVPPERALALRLAENDPPSGGGRFSSSARCRRANAAKSVRLPVACDAGPRRADSQTARWPRSKPEQGKEEGQRMEGRIGGDRASVCGRVGDLTARAGWLHGVQSRPPPPARTVRVSLAALPAGRHVTRPVLQRAACTRRR